MVFGPIVDTRPAAGGGGASTFIGLTDTPASYSGQALRELRVNAVANAVEFVDQYAAAHTYAALQTLLVGIQITDEQAIKDSAGDPRILPFTIGYETRFNSALRVGPFDLSGYVLPGAIGINIDPLSAGERLLDAVFPATTTYAASAPRWFYAGALAPFVLTAPTASAIVFEGAPSVTFGPAVSAGVFEGMSFTPQAASYATTVLTRMAALAGKPSVSGSGAVNLLAGLYLPAPTVFSTPTITDLVGVDIGNYGNAQAASCFGVRIANITAGANRRLIEALGLTSYNLRAEAGDPAANQSQILIAVNNGAVVLRRVEIGAAESGGAGYRMLRVAN